MRALYRRRAGDFAHHRHALYRQPELLSKILLPGSVLYRLLTTLLHYRWFVAGVVLLVAFSASYLVFPCQRSTLRQVLPGSLAASCGWVIFSGLFSHYVKRFGASSIYGSISIVAFTMLWLYFCMCIFFYGATLNRYVRVSKKKS